MNSSIVAGALADPSTRPFCGIEGAAVGAGCGLGLGLLSSPPLSAMARTTASAATRPMPIRIWMRRVRVTPAFQQVRWSACVAGTDDAPAAALPDDPHRPLAGVRGPAG